MTKSYSFFVRRLSARGVAITVREHKQGLEYGPIGLTTGEEHDFIREHTSGLIDLLLRVGNPDPDGPPHNEGES